MSKPKPKGAKARGKARVRRENEIQMVRNLAERIADGEQPSRTQAQRMGEDDVTTKIKRLGEQ